MTPDDVRELAEVHLKAVAEAGVAGNVLKTQALLQAIPAIQLTFLAEIAAQLIEIRNSIDHIQNHVANMDDKI